MDRIWKCSPLPAVHIVSSPAGPTLEANDAARQWAQCAGVEPGDWLALAQSQLACADADADAEPGQLSECVVGPARVRGVRVALATGLLLWLQPLPARAPEIDERVARMQAAAERNERALALAGVTVWQLDLATQRIHMNAVGYASIGQAEDPAGLPIEVVRDLIHPQDLDAVVAAANQAVQSQRVVDVQGRYRQPDGSWRTLFTRRVAHRDAQGRAVALVGISLDVTEQAAERERADMLAERGQLVAEGIGVGFWSRDLDSDEAHWDEQMCRIHRHDPSLAPPSRQAWLDHFVHPQDRARVGDEMELADNQWLGVTEATFRIPDGDQGDPRWVHAWGRRVLRGDRRMVFGMHMDVSDRQREQTQVERERERTRFAIDAAAIGVWERDREGHLVYWNDAMYQQRGLDPADPRPLDELAQLCTNKEDLASLAQLFRQHVESGAPYRHELRVQRANGQWRWLLTQGHALHDARGQVLGVVGVNLDITERKQAQAQQHETQRIENAARDKSAFMARMSHELRTPMNAVLGFTRLLREDLVDPASERQLERLDHITQASERLLAMIDDVLELSRLEAQPEAAAQPCALAPLLAQACAAVQPEAVRRGVSLVLPARPARGSALSDPRALVQALTHLLTHAVHAAPPGEKIVVDAEVAGGLAWIRLVCPPRRAVQAELPFDAGHDSAQAMELDIAHQLLRGLGGVLASNTFVDGSVSIELRLNALEATQRQLEVLCVEDNPVNLLLVRELVSLRPGVNLRTAVDCQSGLLAAQEARPDVVLMDLHLPDGNGADLMRQMRAMAHMSGCHYVAVSADAMPEHVDAALGAGFDDYWTKPINFDRFLVGLDRLLAQKV